MKNNVLKRFRVGIFLYFQRAIYQITSLEHKRLLINVVDVETGIPRPLALKEMVAPDQPHPLLTATTQDSLKWSIERLEQPQESPPEVDVDTRLIGRAQELIDSVNQVNDELEKRRLNALADNSEFNQTEELRAITKMFGMSIATYYNYLKKAVLCQNNRAAIARTFYRNKPPSLSKAEEHFLVTMITSYSTLNAAEILECLKIHFEQKKRIWINPDHCEQRIPEKLVAELLDLNKSIEEISANAENIGLLAPIDLVSRSKFYEFYRAYVATPGTGQEVVEKVLGKGS